MKSKYYLYASLGLTGLFLFAACSSKPTEIAASTEAASEQTSIASISVAADECIACHTDKQRLIDTAAPIVEAEGESKGVG